MTASARISPSDFAGKWLASRRPESATYQEHFVDICRMLGEPTPNEADPDGSWYAFQKDNAKSTGGQGFADVWKRDHFAWEYKGKHKDLRAAYNQLLLYKDALGNPPLLVVCDLDRFEVHTNFTSTEKKVYPFSLEDLRKEAAEPLRVLRAVFANPDELRPTRTREQVTEQAATRFAALADQLRLRGHDPHGVAHFLNKILFCFFAEDVGILPRGLLRRLAENTRRQPQQFTAALADLFAKMSEKGGLFGVEPIPWINGGLFDDAAVLPLAMEDMGVIADASRFDWSQIEPSVLGTLFERGMDPNKRGQLGAHYTDRQSILRVVEPVVMTPLRREFAAMRTRVKDLLAKGRRSSRPTDAPVREFRAFLERLRSVRVLDPACGSGNFLYVTLQLLKDLEKEALLWGALTLQMPQEFPGVDPETLLGIELNPYAAELARVSIWIGHIQWMIANGFGYAREPLLRPLENIECRDAILVREDGKPPREADWPDAEFIVGNPPFLGGKKMRTDLGDAFVDDLFSVSRERVPPEADFVCYWHEKARALIEARRVKRAGLLATNSIRGGANRRVLERIKQSGDIFLAWSDEPWVVEGAAVRVSIIGQDDGAESSRSLDGEPVSIIHSNLTGGSSTSINITSAGKLGENVGHAFQGPVLVGPFDVEGKVARQWVLLPSNTNGRPNADVLRPLRNGRDITSRPRDRWLIDFVRMPEDGAALFEVPFEYVRQHVRPLRANNPDRSRRERWWLHGRTGDDFRGATRDLARYIACSQVSKHRFFVWLHPSIQPHQTVIAIARDDDYAFGVLHSRAHELWSLRLGTWLGVGNDPRYTPTTTFETFPFPWPLNTPDGALTSEQAAHRDAIAEAARRLNEQRERWLNPPELVKVEPDVLPLLPPRLLPVDEKAAKELAKRTLTNLYNARPTWLANLHRDLDRAVFAAYAWPDPISDDEILKRLLELNQRRARAQEG